MRLSRIYQSQLLTAGSTIELDKEAAHYLGQVLRLNPGDRVNPFNERDGEFTAEVVELERRRGRIRLFEPVLNTANPRLTVHLGLGLSRGERMDYAIQKSTELGVFSITPLVTEYCEVKLNAERQRNKVRHWQRIAISACEQCGRSHVPSIAEPESLDNWLTSHPGGLMLDHRGDTTLDTAQPDGAISLLVGPEGGFSDNELASAREHHYRITTLGPRILRTETAPVAALTLLHYLFGDLRG